MTTIIAVIIMMRSAMKELHRGEENKINEGDLKSYRISAHI